MILIDLREFVDSDYTYLNAELARHYRMRGVTGDHMRRVSLDADSPRGGLFGQGSVLAVTSFPGRTSPVVRGKWILENILGTPPPPPPPNVPELDDGDMELLGTLRERMQVIRRGIDAP